MNPFRRLMVRSKTVTTRKPTMRYVMPKNESKPKSRGLSLDAIFIALAIVLFIYYFLGA